MSDPATPAFETLRAYLEARAAFTEEDFAFMRTVEAGEEVEDAVERLDAEAHSHILAHEAKSRPFERLREADAVGRQIFPPGAVIVWLVRQR